MWHCNTYLKKKEKKKPDVLVEGVLIHLHSMCVGNTEKKSHLQNVRIL